MVFFKCGTISALCLCQNFVIRIVQHQNVLCIIKMSCVSIMICFSTILGISDTLKKWHDSNTDRGSSELENFIKKIQMLNNANMPAVVPIKYQITRDAPMQELWADADI